MNSDEPVVEKDRENTEDQTLWFLRRIQEFLLTFILKKIN